MEKCPYCGSTAGVFWYDYGNVFEYYRTFGKGIERREVSEITKSGPDPVWCRCWDCKKRIRIKDVEKA